MDFEVLLLRRDDANLDHRFPQRSLFVVEVDEQRALSARPALEEELSNREQSRLLLHCVVVGREAIVVLDCCVVDFVVVLVVREGVAAAVRRWKSASKGEATAEAVKRRNGNARFNQKDLQESCR
jgi:hypothetical protein